MSSTSCTTVSASAPGKVLIVGGYLVLQEGTSGLVISATSRFVATLSRSLKAAPATAGPLQADLTVQSPQFHRNWDYTLHADSESQALFVTPKDPSSRNVFVEEAVNTSLAAAIGKVGFNAACNAAGIATDASFTLLLQADNDFYSQRSHLVEKGLPVCSASLASLPRFMPCPVDPETGKTVVNKTGLGSSAALTTAVCAAVLGLTGAATASGGADDDGVSKALIHVSAQVAHGLAQGKVGSGFDVCSAAYGSCSYTRVPPAVLGDFMAALEKALNAVKKSATTPTPTEAAGEYAAAAKLLAAAADKEASLLGGKAAAADEAGGWRVGVQPFGLPPGLKLLLADVVGGSETPSMVRQVLAWKEGKSKRGEEEVAKVLEAARATNAGAAEKLDALSISSSSSSVGEEETEAILACVSIASADAACADDEEVAEQQRAMRAAIASSVGPALWKGAAAANARASVVVEQLRKLSSSHPEAYSAALARAAQCVWTVECDAAVDAAASGDGNEKRALSKLRELSRAFADCRFILRAIGEAAGVPIEPKEQTALADATLTKVKGVLAAGVPGAGGFDALFAIHVEPSSSPSAVRDAVEKVWLEWPGGGLTPLLLSNGPAHGEKGAGAEITFS